MNVDIETLNRVMDSNPEEYDEQAAGLLLIIKLYAKDLLDARDIIEKQKAMLRDMREVMKLNVDRLETLHMPAETLRCMIEKSKEFV
jgi:hypothetical protein